MNAWVKEWVRFPTSQSAYNDCRDSSKLGGMTNKCFFKEISTWQGRSGLPAAFGFFTVFSRLGRLPAPFLPEQTWPVRLVVQDVRLSILYSGVRIPYGLQRLRKKLGVLGWYNYPPTLA